MSVSTKREKLKEEILDRLEACVKLQLLLILVPVRRLLVNKKEDRFYHVIYDIVEDVRGRLQNILGDYDLRTIGSPDWKIAKIVEELSGANFFGKLAIGFQNGKITFVKKEESLRLEEL